MTRVYIGHLSYRVRERDLEKFFRGFGKIREVLLKNGFGFVEFDDDRDADDAVYELNGRELDGERVVVELAHGTARRAPAARSYMDTPVNRYGPPTRTDYRVIIENLSSRISWQSERACGGMAVRAPLLRVSALWCLVGGAWVALNGGPPSSSRGLDVLGVARDPWPDR
ncbi:serine-arginine protein 55 isoform X4 [Ixodes scapularis]|uniref:serine-arginine protein 55 isoform X4 n=1 Tax=Ixodes scapularis TaxID=6945 RepID=UPI001A9D8563|nr:serine-arginine protein 55 isoform X4 [Ixodes scapularis]